MSGNPTTSVPAPPQDGPVEMIRALRVARCSAMKARIQAGNQLLGLLTRAPEELRAKREVYRYLKAENAVMRGELVQLRQRNGGAQ
jgi:hypothetical protein